jgi:3',5'-cyclic AMP phosphodiesterase CpdA
VGEKGMPSSWALQIFPWNPTRYLFLAVLFVSSMLAGLPIHSQSQPLATPPAITVTPVTRTFVVWGDIRFTDPAQCDKSDPDLRQAIIQGIAAADPRPDFAILTGDVVYHGHDSNDWEIFAKQTKPLRDAKIKLFPVLGNHDVDGGSGRPDFFKRFPDLKSYPQLEKDVWYSMTYGNSLFLMLDSQSDYRADSPQGIWLRSALKGVPDDLDFLFIVLHHPVVTRASQGPGRVPVCKGRKMTVVAPHGVEDSEKKLKLMLEDFSQSHPLTRLVVLSGHNHNYERYVDNRITYIVTGGGGATPYQVKRDPNDAYHESGPAFHYCKISLDDKELVFEMFKLNTQDGTWKQSDAFRLPRLSKTLSQ